MRLRILNINHILLTAFLILSFQINIYSQGTDISRGKQPSLFVGLSLGPSQSQIINIGTLSISDLLANKKSSFFGFVDIGYFFSNYFGLSSGIGYTSYNTQLTLSTYQNTPFGTTDSENEAYKRSVSGSDIKEIQKISFLSIPFCINFRLPFNKTIGFYLQSGVNLAITLNRNYVSSGTFSYTGYYPEYNVTLENLPQYGFSSNVSISKDGELELKSLVFNAIASAGFDFFIQKKIQFAIAAYFNKSLSNISGYSSPDKFQLSSEINQINSMMGGTSKATTQSVGLRLSIRYYLK
jgi:hypothetical protein